MNEHPCNSCGTVEAPIVTDSGYCQDCADEALTPAEEIAAERLGILFVEAE